MDLVAEVAASPEVDAGTTRWLAIEHLRLGRAFKLVALEDPSLLAGASRWTGCLQPDECDEVLSRFELDMIEV